MGVVARRIRELRELRGLSQEELGRRVGVTRRVVWTWEAERSAVPAEEIPAVAAALSVPISDFYSEIEPPPLPQTVPLAEKLSELLNVSPERIEINVYAQGSYRQSTTVRPLDEPHEEIMAGQDYMPPRGASFLRRFMRDWKNDARRRAARVARVG